MNTPGSAGGSTTSKKKKKTPVSIEEVFNQISVINASNVNPPPGNVLLTPRSAEVCLKLGVNPEILKVRDIDSFWESGLDPSLQRMRHEAYVQRRHDCMKQCRLERKKIINQQLEKSAKFLDKGGDESMSPEKILQMQAEQSSTLIEMEKARIQKMQKRQERELEQMIEFEISRAKVQEDMNKRIEEAKKKEQLRLKMQEKRLRMVAEERRLRDLQKVAEEEAEEQRRRDLANTMFLKEKELADAQARKREADKRRAREEDAEKKRKHEEHQRATQKFFADHQMELRRRLESMQGAEKKKQDAILQRQQELMEELLKKRAMVEERLQRNMMISKKVEEKRKNDFLENQAHHEAIRKAHLDQQESERQLHAQEILLQEQRRRMLLLEKRREEEENAELLLQKFEEEELAVMKVREVREREHELAKEKQNLKRQMKAENVERVSRMAEYKRMSTLKKIEDVDGRMSSMLAMREKLIEDRRRNAAATKLQKDAIAKVMAEVRTNATKAQKIISNALSGKISLASIAGGKDVKRAKSSSSKRKKKHGGTTDSLLRNQSAGDVDDLNQSFQSSMRFTKDGNLDNLETPKPYVSPYEEDPSGAGQKITL